MAFIRKTSWSEDYSIYMSACRESEGRGNIPVEMELSSPPGEKHSDSWNHGVQALCLP